MDNLQRLITFLEKLDNEKFHYRLNKIRHDSVIVEIAVPGERWEVEFMWDGQLEIERFRSDSILHNETELEILFQDFGT